MKSIMNLLFLIFLTVALAALHQTEARLKIINGTSADIKYYPYTALMRIKDNSSCGATFISDQILLTAAHCVLAIDVADLSFHVGSTDAESGGEIIQAASKIPHENYCADFKCLDYDIALVSLVNPPVTVNITPAPLPNENTSLTEGTVATVLGWGFDGNEAFKDLRKLEVPVISLAKCAEIYDFAGINDRMICAGYIEGGKDYCWGDSGGPLVFNDTLVGIVSWASACGVPNKPGAYVNVAAFRSWIKDNSGI